VKAPRPYAPVVEGSSVLREDPAPYGDTAVLQTQADEKRLNAIELCDAALKNAYADKLQLAPSLSRSLVSFQANKTRAVFRWFKYKEAFSSALVEYLLQQYRVKTGVILDPFAGIGTALFAAGGTLKGEGIELLPIGQLVIETKQLIDWRLEPSDVTAGVSIAQPGKRAGTVRYGIAYAPNGGTAAVGAQGAAVAHLGGTAQVGGGSMAYAWNGKANGSDRAHG
jgi:hypothetical protein